MKKLDKKKIVVSSALATAALVGGATVMQGKVSATTQDADASATDSTGASTAAEGAEETTVNDTTVSATNNAEASTKRVHKGGRKHGSKKPADMTDEEWAAKKAERKAKLEEKLSGMSEEEKQEWLENHKKGGHKTSSDGDAATAE